MASAPVVPDTDAPALGKHSEPASGSAPPLEPCEGAGAGDGDEGEHVEGSGGAAGGVFGDGEGEQVSVAG